MFLLFFLVWIILNGRITAEICVLGLLLSAVLFFFICRFMDYSIKKERLLFHLTPLFFQYFFVLIQEIVKANLCVMKIILSPELQPEPALVYFRTELQSGLSKVILANSITLTRFPWKITVFVSTAWIVNWRRGWNRRCLWNYWKRWRQRREDGNN